MSLDGVDRDVERLGDLLPGHRRRQIAQDVQLPSRQRYEDGVGFETDTRRLVGHPVEKVGGEARFLSALFQPSAEQLGDDGPAGQEGLPEQLGSCQHQRRLQLRQRDLVRVRRHRAAGRREMLVDLSTDHVGTRAQCADRHRDRRGDLLRRWMVARLAEQFGLQ